MRYEESFRVALENLANEGGQLEYKEPNKIVQEIWKSPVVRRWMLALK